MLRHSWFYDTFKASRVLKVSGTESCIERIERIAANTGDETYDSGMCIYLWQSCRCSLWKARSRL